MKLYYLAPSIDKRNHIIALGSEAAEKVNISSKLAHIQQKWRLYGI